MHQFNKKLFILSLLVVMIGICLYRFPSDDGLRHVGMAFGNLESWGAVYPFSNFEALKDYDPWFGYDFSLRIIASCLKGLPVSLPALKFLLVKVISLLFSAAFFYLVLTRSGILNDIKDRDTFTLVFIIMIVVMADPLKRILIIRPFAFGSFFLFYAVGQKGLARGVLSSAALTFFYPYLAWFYTIPVAFAHFLKGDKRFALGAIFVTILFLSLQPVSFWGFQSATFKSGLVRNLLDCQIGELRSSFHDPLFYMYLLGFFMLYPFFSSGVKKLNFNNLIILIYLLPALKYIRYFIDLILPMLFISFGRETLSVLLGPYKRLVSLWGETLKTEFKQLWIKVRPNRPAGEKKSTLGKTRPANIKPYIALSYAVILGLLIYQGWDQFSSLNRFRTGLSVIPEGAMVLTEFGLQYKILYARPDLRVIPSCEIGAPAKAIKKEYVNFFNEGEVVNLARKTSVKYFIENRKKYINPPDGRALRLLKKNDELKIWEIEPDFVSGTAASR